jgi:hypothetical protein
MFAKSIHHPRLKAQNVFQNLIATLSEVTWYRAWRLVIGIRSTSGKNKLCNSAVPNTHTETKTAHIQDFWCRHHFGLSVGHLEYRGRFVANGKFAVRQVKLHRGTSPIADKK